MKYAPVLITTLNRSKHLKRCLLSLANNGWAPFTDIYISVDFPPQKKYEEGNALVKQMLDDFDFSVFHCHYIFYQKSNLGPSGNVNFLIDVARKVTDVVITTEDDNEFSPNFLEYINKGLDLFNNDKNTLAICGTTDTKWKTSGITNVVKCKLFPAYGVGMWIDRYEQFVKNGSSFLIDKRNLTIKNFTRLYKRNRYLFSVYITDILLKEDGLYWNKNGELNFCDVPIAIYMHLSEYAVVSPVLSKSRTFGNDGSGVNMAVEVLEEQDIDEANYFDYSYLEGLKYNEDNYKIGSRYLLSRYLNGRSFTMGILLAILGAFLLVLSKGNRKAVMKITNFLRKTNGY